MARDEFVRMDRELAERLRRTGTVEDRERLIIANLRRKEAIIEAEQAQAAWEDFGQIK